MVQKQESLFGREKPKTKAIWMAAGISTRDIIYLPSVKYWPTPADFAWLEIPSSSASSALLQAPDQLLTQDTMSALRILVPVKRVIDYAVRSGSMPSSY